MSWYEAESNCQDHGGNLVSITDRFEQFWLNQFQEGTSVKWIGLSDARLQGTYVWSNNDKFSFSNWDREKPGKTKIVLFKQQNKQTNQINAYN